MREEQLKNKMNASHDLIFWIHTCSRLMSTESNMLGIQWQHFISSGLHELQKMREKKSFLQNASNMIDVHIIWTREGLRVQKSCLAS